LSKRRFSPKLSIDRTGSTLSARRSHKEIRTMATTQPLPQLIGRPATPASGLRFHLHRALHGVLARLAERERLARERRRLAELDDRQLRDIGLTRHQAMREARRHFWE
jgi:uncharacterized protein YjiS (DUF1127 family)